MKQQLTMLMLMNICLKAWRKMMHNTQIMVKMLKMRVSKMSSKKQVSKKDPLESFLRLLLKIQQIMPDESKQHYVRLKHYLDIRLLWQGIEMTR